MNTIDLNGILDKEEVPVCPICLQPIFHYEIVSIAEVDGRLCLIHYYCGEIEFFNT